MSAGEVRALLDSLDPQTKTMAERQPEAFLQQWAMLQFVLAEAEKAKLDQRPPYKEKLDAFRRQTLTQALVDEKTKEAIVLPEQQKKYFEANRDRYFQAKAKVIFVSRASETRKVADQKVIGTTTPEQAKAKAELVAKKARAGEDFVKLAKEFSDDASTSEKEADFPDPIRPNSANIPQNIRDAVLAAKAGDIVGPLEHETGFYLFRVDSVGMPPYEQVQPEIYKELRNAEVRRWLEEVRKRASVSVDDPGFFAGR